MIGRLIADLFRRTWWLHAIGAAQVAMFWILPAVMPGSGAGVFASLSMVVAFGLGPFIAVFALNRPEVFLRPVSSRDLWRTIWVYSVVAVPMVLAVAKAVPIFLLAPVSQASLAAKLQDLLLSALYDAVYCGSLLVFLALALRASRRHVGRRLWRGVCLATFFGGVLWAPVFHAYAAPGPVRFTPALAAALAIAFIGSVVSFLLSPPATRLTERSIDARSRRTPAAAPAGLIASLSGFQIVAWTYGWLVCTGVAGMVVWFFVLTTLFPVTARENSLAWAVPIAAFHPAVFLLRRLRTMPFTPWQLTTLLISGPVINTLAVCAAALLAGLTTGGRSFAEITPVLVVLTVGGGAFVSALQIRLQTSLGSQGMFAVVPLFVIASRIGGEFGQSAAPATILIAGAALFLSAVLLQYRSLTRRNKTFRPIQRLEPPRL